MPVWWGILGLSVVIYFWCNINYKVVKIGQAYEKRATWAPAIIFFGVLIFFCGLRSGVADTGTYIHMFNGYPDSIIGVDWNELGDDKGFVIMSILYKQFISTDFQGWLFLIALASGIVTMLAFKKYSCDFGFTCFLFVATTTFTYLINGMRQYICISILLLCTDWIIQRKFVPYMILVLLLSTIHGSALIFVPLYFLLDCKPWTSRMWFCVAMAVVVGLGFDVLGPVLGVALEDTSYSNYSSIITEDGAGVNGIRFLVVLVPVVLAFVGRHIIEREGNLFIDLCVNMSVLNVCIYFVALFSSGMTLGRIAAYFDIYNLLLLPWIIRNIFTEKSSKLVLYVCFAMYLIFFVYQMTMVWHMTYVSDFLGLYCW